MRNTLFVRVVFFSCSILPAGTALKFHVFFKTDRGHVGALLKFPPVICANRFNEGYLLVRNSSAAHTYVSMEYFSTENDAIRLVGLKPWQRYMVKAFMWCSRTLHAYIQQDLNTVDGGIYFIFQSPIITRAMQAIRLSVHRNRTQHDRRRGISFRSFVRRYSVTADSVHRRSKLFVHVMSRKHDHLRDNDGSVYLREDGIAFDDLHCPFLQLA